MSDRSLRSSTTKQTRAIQDKVEIIKELKVQKQKSRRISELIKNEHNSYALEALNLATSVSEIYGVDSPGSSRTFVNFNSSQNLEEELQWDPSADVESPPKLEESSIFPLSPGDSTFWSTRVNLFPLNCVSTPVDEFENPKFSFSLSLENIVEEIREGTPEEVERSLVINSSSSAENSVFVPLTMDENAFQDRLKTLRNEVRKIERRLRFFDPENISLNDKDRLSGKLDDVRVLCDQASDNIDDLLQEVSYGNDPQSEVVRNRVSILQELDQNLFNKFKTTYKNASDKMVELKAAEIQNAPVVNTAKDDQDKEIKKKKLELRIEKQKAKIVKLNSNVSLLKETNSMDDMEIRKYLLESSKWEKELSTITTAYDAIDEENISIKADEDKKKELDDAYEELVTSLSERISELKLKDEELKLHTFTPNKVKDSITYPSKFSGKDTDDVFTFIKEFRSALSSDHVKKCDEVSKLRASRID